MAWAWVTCGADIASWYCWRCCGPAMPSKATCAACCSLTAAVMARSLSGPKSPWVVRAGLLADGQHGADHRGVLADDVERGKVRRGGAPAEPGKIAQRRHLAGSLL